MNSHKSLLDAIFDDGLDYFRYQFQKLSEEFHSTKDGITKLSSNHNVAKELLSFHQTQIRKFSQKFLHDYGEVVRDLALRLQKQMQIQESPRVICSREVPKENVIYEGPLQIRPNDTPSVSSASFNKLYDFINYPMKANNQIRDLTLKFNSLGITDNSIEALNKAFYKFPHVYRVVLDVGSNSITTRGGIDLAKCFTGLNSLQYLDLSIYNNKIGVEGIDAICSAIALLPSLNSISIDIACTNAGPKGFVNLGQTLFSKDKIKKIWMKVYDLGINDSALREFLQAFKAKKNLMTFSVDLRLNPFDRNLLKLFRADLAAKKMHNFKFITE